MKNVFDVHPNVNELISFEDGTCFFTNQAGKCGANDYEKKTGLKPTLVFRDEEVKEDVKPKNKNK